MCSTRAGRSTLVAPVNARIAVSSSRSIDYPLTASLHIAIGIGRRQRWPSAEQMGENRPVGSRARPVAAGPAARECWLYQPKGFS